MIAEPQGPLWAEVKARYDPWPPDDEVAAQQLGATWRDAAGALTRAGAQVAASGQAAYASWQDDGGAAVQTGAATIGTTFEQLGQQQLRQAVLADDYAASLIRTKQGIHDVIAAYSPLYEAALINPFDDSDMMVVEYINRLVDAAGKQIMSLLTVESQGPDVEATGELPTAESLANGGPLISGELGLYADRGTWRAFGGAVEGEYTTGLHLNGAINQPSSENPLIELEAMAGTKVTGPKFEQPVGPVTFSAQPEVYLGPGAKFSFDPSYENGKFTLGYKAGASPLVGGGLNGEVTLDFGEILRSVFPS